MAEGRDFINKTEQTFEIWQRHAKSHFKQKLPWLSPSWRTAAILS